MEKVIAGVLPDSSLALDPAAPIALTPLERAKNAVLAVFKENDCGYFHVFDENEDEDGKDHEFAWDGSINAYDVARAVIEALREPSEAVRQAMRENIPADGHEWEIREREELSNGIVIDPIADCWNAMIDAVLEEG